MIKIRALVIALTFIMTSAIYAEPVQLKTTTGTIYGTLEFPQNISAPYQVALIIAGSGPTDRDGNSALLPGPNNSLKMLAESLAAQGIASLRYDKRGIGQSAAAMVDEKELRFETLIEDACLWGQQLKNDGRFSRLTVIGHSEGALIGLVAAKQVKADAFVSIAGASQPAGELILQQVASQLPEELEQKCREIVEALNRGETVSDVPTHLAALFRPSVQPYLISWFRYKPVEEIGKFPGQILIVQGTSDIQVSEEDAKALAKAQPRAELLIIPGMNHVLKNTPSEREKQLASYSDPSLPINQTLVDAIARFVVAT
jgi:fermentation-respiration switch protein FrsA (DUF1100 family)